MKFYNIMRKLGKKQREFDEKENYKWYQCVYNLSEFKMFFKSIKNNRIKSEHEAHSLSGLTALRPTNYASPNEK